MNWPNNWLVKRKSFVERFTSRCTSRRLIKALVHALFGYLELIFGGASIFDGLQQYGGLPLLL